MRWSISESLNIGNHWPQNKDLLFISNFWIWRHHRASPLSVCVCVRVCVCACVCVCISPFWVSWSLLPLPVAVRRRFLWVLVSPHPEQTFAAVFLSRCVSADTHRYTLSYVLYTSTYGCWRGSVLFLVWPVIANIKTVCYLFCNLVSFLFKHLLLLISVINNVLPTNQQLALHRLATTRNQHQQRITLIRT